MLYSQKKRSAKNIKFMEEKNVVKKALTHLYSFHIEYGMKREEFSLYKFHINIYLF